MGLINSLKGEVNKNLSFMERKQLINSKFVNNDYHEKLLKLDGTFSNNTQSNSASETETLDFNEDSLANNVKMYEVKSGDSLSKIAQENGTTVEELVKINNIDNPNVIHPNQEIILPDSSTVDITETIDNVYVVKNGDSLSKIAQENGTTVEELCKLNGIDEKDYIKTGQKIKVSQDSSEVTSGSGLQNGSVNSSASGSTDTSGGNGTSSSNGEFSQAGSDNSSSQKGINNSLKDGKDSSLGESMPKKVEVSKYKISENTTEAPELDVDDEKALYIHYIQVMKDILSEHGIQTEKGVTNYETIVSFGKFLSNKSSNLSEDEVENFTGFYNSILEEQILLLQSDKEVFDDFVKYLNVSEEEQKELYSEFEKGNGISAMAYSEIVNINSKISEVEKETKKLNEELSKYSNGNFKYYDDVLGAQKSEISQKIKENKKSLSELKQQRYNLQQQYNKSLYNYLIDLRDNKDYKELIKLDGKVQIEKLDLSTPEGSTKLTDFPLEELKSAILSRGPVFIQGDPEFADYNITANNCIEIIETLYQDDEFVKTVLGNEKEKTRKNFIDSCFGNATDIQSEFNKVLRVYSYMSDDQVNDYLYLLKKDGEGPERAINYVDALQDDANRYYGEIRAKEELEKIISKKTTIEEVLSSFGISTKDGIEGALNNLSITFTGDTTTTVQQYASQYFLQTLELSSMFTELDENDIQDMINDKDNPLDPTIAKYLKTLEHPTGLDILLKSEQITEEDYKFYLSLKEKEPYKQYIEELANKGEVNKLCIKYAYNTGLNVGNMLPSIATSAVFSFAGLASIGQSAASLVMFGGAYGSAYQQGIQSGKDMNDAVMYAMISASSEVLTERFLGRTPGISNAKKFVETSAEAVYTSTKSLFINTLKTVAADLVCEVSEEELQNIIEIIDDGFTGGTFDFSGIKEESVDTAVVTVLSTLILGLPTNAINTKNSYVNMKDFNNGKFSIKLEDGTVVPMTMDYLTKNNIVDAKAKEINLEKLHEYFAECKNNDVVSIDKKTSSEIIGIINQKLKEQGIDKTYSEITLMGYDGNVAVYGSEIANLIEQLVPIEKSEYKKGSYIRDAKKVISNVSSKMSDRISNLKTNMTEISSNVVNGFKNIKESSLEFSKHLSPSNSKKEFINFVQNFEYQNPNMYNSISEIDSSTKNQVRTYGDMKKLEKKLNSVFNMKDIDYKKAAYRALVSISNADVRALPTNQEITSFYKKFSNTEKYIISDFQKGSFSHIKSVDYNEKTTKRLYINNVNFSDTITFSTLFAEKCEERGIPFYFKTADMSRGAENIKKLNLTRDESIVIYSSDKYITDYVNICEEIREETQMKFNAPPVLSGVVNDFLGYGDEYLNHRISYNSLRSEVVSSALKETNKAYFGKEYNVESLMENLRKDSSKYKSYLTLFYNNIKKYSKINGVDSNSFFLNAKENVQTGQTKTETLDNLVENLPNSQSTSQNDSTEIQKIYSESRDTFTQIQKKELIKNKIKKYSNSILNLFFNVEEDDVIDKATDLVLEKGIEVSLAYDIAVRMLEDGYSYDYALESINIEKEAIDNRVSRDVVWFAKLNNISDLKLAECMYDYGLNEKYAKMVIENGEDAKVMQILCKNEESIYNVSNNDIGVAEKIATIMLTKDITDPRMALLFLKYPGISKNVAKIMADYNNITYELAIYMEKNNINNPYVADLMQKGISKDLALFMVLTKVNNPDIASIMMKNGFPPKIAEELYINKRNILDWESWSKNYKKDTERISQLASSKVKKIFDAYTNTSESLVNSHMGYYGFLNQIMRGNFYNEKTGCINWGSTIGTVEMTIENFEREILNDTTSAGQFYEDQLVAGSIMNNFINNYGSLKESAVLIRGADIESLMSVMGYNGQKMNLKGKKIEEIADLINNSELFYNDKGFMSCSVEPMDVTTGRNVIYVIDCKSGTKALTTDFGFGGKEHEVLLGANQKFKMQKADVKDGILYIYMRN